MNDVKLFGRLTKDPELRYTQSGKAVASFTLAIDRNYSKNNEEKTADFIPCIAWEKTAEICSQYLFKGDRVLVENGRIQVRSYVDKNEQKRWVTEVVISKLRFIEKKSDGKNQTGENADYSSWGKDVFPDEEIPF